MSLSAHSKASEKRRLAWRCRRGMLELDIVLQRFVANQFEALNLAEMQAFDTLLKMPDNEFWTLISVNDLPTDAVQRTVIEKLKAV